MLTQERAIICEPEFPNYEAGWPGGGARPLSWVAPWWQPVALSFASALVGFLRLWGPGYPPLRAGRKVPGWAVPRHGGPICRERPAM